MDNATSQEADDIAQVPAPEPHPMTAVRSRVVANPIEQAAEDIRPTGASGNAPRLANGFKIVENRAYQRKQKIARAPLTVPADDEMGHKKLFTRFEEAFTTRDIAALRDCLSPAFTWKLPNGQVVYGRDAALNEMERRFAMPNGPKFSASVWRFRGNTVLQTYDVEYCGPDGRWRQSQGFDLYEIGDGLITLKDAYWKMIP
ncbi:nuclear transport factor 2 family protein [Shimia biformata]|uniref:nuclear transport factor 2 family protein n=1 Tax=Shimia biformata TaxID=1294299 RepID=UPI001950FE55|nr:nuclear transport factor 2 family protein [Shimia biformata]